MTSPIRCVFREVDSQLETQSSHIHQVRLPRSGKLRSLYARASGLTPGQGTQYKVRLYNGPPASSCWIAELTIDQLATDPRSADALEQGLELHLASTFWVTYALENATVGNNPMLKVELMVEA